MSRARQGKIARLPHQLREEVNLRLLNGETGGQILAWLNSQPAAVEAWDAHFEGAPATAQNLSEWRLGGYKDWLRRREKVESTKTLAKFATSLVRSAGDSLASGSAAIAAGNILARIEGAADEELADLLAALRPLLSDERERARLDLAREKHELKKKEVALSREKFESQTVEQFLRWAGTEDARQILDSGKSQRLQAKELRELMFGKVVDR